MSYRIKAVTLATIVAAFFISPVAEAKITIQPDFQGTLLITFPDGKVQMYDAGEALPEIPSGTSIEIFGGKMSLSTDQGDSVKLTCLGSEASVGGGASCSMGCSEAEGKLNVTKGPVQVTQGDGTQKSITDGQEYPIKAKEDDNAQNPPPTSEGQPALGTPAPDAAPPPDSTSMETSSPAPETTPPSDSRSNETSPS